MDDLLHVCPECQTNVCGGFSYELCEECTTQKDIDLSSILPEDDFPTNEKSCL
jgi:hypothetical protein